VATNSAEKQPIFQNPMSPDKRSKRRRLPDDDNIDGWVDVLSLEREVDVNPLLTASPRSTAKVERKLRTLGGEIQLWNARRISHEADRRFDAIQFAQYQNQLETATQA